MDSTPSGLQRAAHVARTQGTRSVQSGEDTKDPWKRLMMAIQDLNNEEVRKIVDNEIMTQPHPKRLLNSCDPNDEKQYNPILMACKTVGNKQYDIVSFLLSKGADVKSKTATGASVIFLAAGNKAKESVLQSLVDAGAKIDYPTFRKQTPLFACAEDGYEECVKFLINAGADLNFTSIKGETPVMRAAENGHLSCVKLLQDAGANLNLRDSMGWDAYHMAKEQDHQEIMSLLVDETHPNHAHSLGPPEYPIDEDFGRPVKSEEDVDEMKIQTMFKMVDECRVIAQGKDVMKKVLYLTNKQAVMFDEDAMERAVQALDIGEPKFVIKLVDSSGLSAQMRIAHPEQANDPESFYGKSTFNTSEMSTADERVVETQILLFMKTCILPLAMQTKALILVCGSNDCYLSTALARVAVAEQARLGKDCPFTVLATASELDVHAKAVSPDPKDRNSIAQQIARASPAWGKRIVDMNKFYSKKLLPNDTRLSQCDLTDAAERYIIFESFEEGQDEDDLGSYNDAPRKLFESTFLQYMTRRLPSIAIQCLFPDHGVPFLVDLANRNIPVLLLDTRERAFTLEKYDPKYVPLTDLAKEAEQFPTLTREQYETVKIYDGSLTMEGRITLLNVAMEMMERTLFSLRDADACDSLIISTLAYFHSVLTIGNEVGESVLVGAIPLHARVREMEKLERTNKDAKRTGVPPELASKVMEFIYTKMSAIDKECQLARVDAFIKGMKKSERYLKADAIKLKTKLTAECDAINAAGGLYKNYDLDATEWLSFYDILTSSNTFSGSIFDLDEAKRILGSVAKIDRLPNANTLEALRVLQDAWDHVEVYHAASQEYKLISKVTYILLLIGSVCISFLAMSQAILGVDESLAILGLSFASSAIASYVTFVNPAIKWQQLRMAALSIESNIWTFRTRAGPYRTRNDSSYDQSAEHLLAEVIKDVKEKVLEGADIKQSAFYSRMYSTNAHGQHPPVGPTFGAMDNFTRLIALEREENERRGIRNSKVNAYSRLVFKYSRRFFRGARRFFLGTIRGKKTTMKTNSNVVAASPSPDSESGHHRAHHIFSSKDVESLHPHTKTAPTGDEEEDDWSQDGNESVDEEEEDEDLPVGTVTPFSEKKLPSPPKRRQESRSTLTRKASVHFTELRKMGDSDLVSSGKKSTPLAQVLTFLRRDTDEMDGHATVDSHYEPVQPDAFIRFRVIPAINFYKGRIPRCHRTRNVSQVLLVLGSLSSAILAIVGFASWASGVSILTASITAYLEFSGTSSKISRYSFTVDALQGLCYWWQTLPQIDRSVVSNIDRLVLTCEELLQREQQAWRSTSQTVRMLQKQSQHDSSGGAKDKPE